jgi:hypothetical protein
MKLPHDGDAEALAEHIGILDAASLAAARDQAVCPWPAVVVLLCATLLEVWSELDALRDDQFLQWENDRGEPAA